MARFITRVVLKNYKSIAACDVTLGDLTFLVGPNGSGKSNFVDALRFVADSLNTTLDHAMRDRGGIAEVRRRSGGHPTHFGVRVDFTLPSGVGGRYGFRVAARRGSYEVQEEECYLYASLFGDGAYFRVVNGKVDSSAEIVPAYSSDRLYLVSMSGTPDFQPIYEALSTMGFYSLNPDQIRDLQAPDAGTLLTRDGGNLASVLGRLEEEAPETKKLIEEYLQSIVPGVTSIGKQVVGPEETLEFRQRVPGATFPWRFPAANMSDGTLRAVGVLVALFQQGIPLVAIEEPEVALHPAAAGVLYDALMQARETKQVLVTSHSPDLLDDPGIPSDAILAVVSREGSTEIGSVDDASRQVLSERLYTPGELLRLDQLAPAPSSTSPGQVDLFAS